ncbi:fimbrial biogenesis chaperone [Sinorhizobium meliloti]|uniref:fimbrial biogenesis chaperone n=1 Tax=Rhizobium meliloti TaxID=382 RepID=UPI000360D5FF|nr:molecular chaperone [Sinorhizobium meliloti]PND20673.1 pilus assembly protein [Ensifer sp. MMN_5]RVQ00912.1 molecular chaperone [Sinorhizobium meliloti]
MCSMLKSIGLAVLLLLYTLTANAASLVISPTSVERVAPDRAAVLHLRNQVNRPVDIEVRVLRWSKEGGVEQLKPTNDVVASPPSARLPPHGNRIVSVVRVSKEPLRLEESYRVLIDELPDPKGSRSGAESVAVQHVLPVLFRTPDASASEVDWSLARSRGWLMLVVENNGAGRLRLSDVKLMQGGEVIARRDGFVGYVLPGLTRQWRVGTEDSYSGGLVTLSAKSNGSAIDAQLGVSAR